MLEEFFELSGFSLSEIRRMFVAKFDEFNFNVNGVNTEREVSNNDQKQLSFFKHRLTNDFEGSSVRIQVEEEPNLEA